MLYQSTVHPGGWFSLAEMAACLRFLFFIIPYSFPFLASSSLVISYSLLSGALLISSAVPSTFSFTDKQRSVSLHNQVYEAGLQIVEFSCQGDFFLGIVWFWLISLWDKDHGPYVCPAFTASVSLLILSIEPGFVDFIQTKYNDWV